jgi:hypothetical protein
MKTGAYHIMLGSGFKGRRLSSRIPAQNRKRRLKLFWCVQLVNDRHLVLPGSGTTAGANWVFLSAQPGTARHLGGTLVPRLRSSTCDACTVGRQFRRSSQQRHGTSVAIAVVAVVVLLHVLSLVLALPVASL